MLANDDDFWWFDLASGESADVVISFVDALGDVDMRVFDAVGGQVGQSAGVTDTEVVHVSNQGATTARYTVEVYLFGGAACNDYDIEVVPLVGVCVEDVFESNDTQAQAVLVDAPVDAAILANDEDWWRVDLASGEQANLLIEYVGYDNDIYAARYDASGFYQEAWYGTAGQISMSFAHQGGAWPESWYIQVIPYYGSCVDYVLDPGVELNTCVDDGWEPNDVLGGPSISAPTSATVVGTDDDYWQILVEPGGSANVEVSYALGQGDVYVYVYDLYGYIVASGVGSFGLAQAYVEHSGWVSYDEAYYVRVFDADGAGCVDYVLDPGLSGSNCVNDVIEPNDDFDGAVFVIDYVSATLPGSDSDWWSFDVAASGSVDVVVDYTGPDDLVIDVYDDVQNYVGSAYGYLGQAVLTVTNSSATARSYAAVVAPDAVGACVDYTFSLGVSDVCAEDGSEPNDDAASALSGGLSRDATVTSLSEDWWTLSVGPGVTVAVDLAFIDANGDIDLALYASDGATLLDSSGSTSNQEQVTYTNSSGVQTTLYAQVYLYSGTCNDYTYTRSNL